LYDNVDVDPQNLPGDNAANNATRVDAAWVPAAESWRVSGSPLREGHVDLDPGRWGHPGRPDRGHSDLRSRGSVVLPVETPGYEWVGPGEVDGTYTAFAGKGSDFEDDAVAEFDPGGLSQLEQCETPTTEPPPTEPPTDEVASNPPVVAPAVPPEAAPPGVSEHSLS
jgi:hypothetical protein